MVLGQRDGIYVTHHLPLYCGTRSKPEVGCSLSKRISRSIVFSRWIIGGGGLLVKDYYESCLLPGASRKHSHSFTLRAAIDKANNSTSSKDDEESDGAQLPDSCVSVG